MKQLTTELDYNNGIGIVPDGEFRISASGIADFFTNTTQWYRDNLLDEKSFIGNQSTLIGTIVHYCAEQFAKQQTLTDHNNQQITDYITKSTNDQYVDYIPDTSEQFTIEQYKPMALELINSYVRHNMPVVVEPFISMEILPGIHVGGSIDALYNNQPLTTNELSSIDHTKPVTIVDYKTTSSLQAPTQFSYKYKLQLLTYAYVLKHKYNITVDKLKLVYITQHQVNRISEKTGKPLKDYPSKVSTIIHQLTDEDMDVIHNIIQLIAHSIQHWNNHPEHHYLLAQDWRLHDN